MIRFFSILLLTIVTFRVFARSYPENSRLFTLVKVYGIIKYYNNDKKDSELDRQLISILDHLDKHISERESFNTMISGLLHPYIMLLDTSLNVELEIQIHIIPPKWNDCILTLDYSWINENEELSDKNKHLLMQLLANHRPVANSNIKKGNTAVHIESKGLMFEDSGTGFTAMLVKYWNVINYFFVYKNLMDETWDSVLWEMIPSFPSINTKEEYVSTLIRMSAKMNDSHADIYDGRYDDMNVFKLPFIIHLSEGHMVIEGINDSISNFYNFHSGDIIMEINNKTLADYWEECSKTWSFSTPQAGRDYFKLFMFLFFNHNDSAASITIKSGNTIHREIIKTILFSEFRRFHPIKPPTQLYRSINDRSGYINFPLISYSDLRKAYHSLKNKEYLIIDCRGHTSGFKVVRLINILRIDNVAAGKFYKPDFRYPGIFDRIKVTKFNYLPRFYKPYTGKVVLLINQNLKSAMESLLLAIKAQRPGTVFIGSATSGTSGQQSFIDLPYVKMSSFTGMGLSYPDGSQLQRLGIHPDINVEPTIKSIKDNRDMILERAVEYIDTH